MTSSGPRLPTLDDFRDTTSKTNPILDIIPPPSGASVNVLILLHGLGDTNASFTQLARNMKLPNTVCISLQGPHPLPDMFNPLDRPAFHWGDDVNFDTSKEGIDFDAGFTTSTTLLIQIILTVLTTKCNFPPRNIFFLGFGQGGMAALQAIREAEADAERQKEFGGVVTIGGKMSEKVRVASGEKCRTPVLVCGGSRSSEITTSSLAALRQAFQTVEYIKWAKSGDSMPSTAAEMQPLFAFWSRRMRALGVEGAVEI